MIWLKVAGFIPSVASMMLLIRRAWLSSRLRRLHPPHSPQQPLGALQPAQQPGRRDGFKEMLADEQEKLARRSQQYAGVKLAAELYERRMQRFVLHDELDSAPTNAKVIYLVQHGEAAHDVWCRAELAAGRTPSTSRRSDGSASANGLHDPLLTHQGEADAAAAAERARQLPQPELIVTSPLRRATQTALVTFADAISSGVPVVAHELCREAWVGSEPPIWDSHLARDALIKAYPLVEYQRYAFGEEDPPSGPVGPLGGKEIDDPLWWWCATPYGWSPRGFDEALVAEHAFAFVSWLMRREERTLAVASHAHFLLALHHACLDASFEQPQVLHAGELRRIIVCAEPAPPTTGHYHTNPAF
mmetsp:Transcript_25549/g.55222  ORF Transcript_25549/g.55222 Transcript_25549/m.55222 type:complete len:360 (-) Transcript_25549:289-1368(-)|eukprot:CAMPEP_0183332648 /NCGR_PEP_ID=MMETSP0164_2-20130417/1755_1 /TAXON_ID=221442 /ORGANISM="Coccolithus pelagicus ssp braarudi, Strain PLY182g" /LENGTH=359 /DNA_ID=CAMNT_0025501405 /DNA_START=35 /DNA_END=1114 /DNA_ORIENTATION=+